MEIRQTKYIELSKNIDFFLSIHSIHIFIVHSHFILSSSLIITHNLRRNIIKKNGISLLIAKLIRLDHWFGLADKNKKKIFARLAMRHWMDPDWLFTVSKY